MMNKPPPEEIRRLYCEKWKTIDPNVAIPRYDFGPEYRYMRNVASDLIKRGVSEEKLPMELYEALKTDLISTGLLHEIAALRKGWTVHGTTSNSFPTDDLTSMFLSRETVKLIAEIGWKNRANS